jgi:ATP-dependent Lon protease
MRRLPLFVLPTVLFPHTRIPLHVFESRYRQMIARCLEYDRQFGLLFHSNDLYGPFEVEAGRVGCVAEIEQFQPLPDGRSLMITAGVDRFRIADGVESKMLYYEALVEEYKDAEEIGLDLIGRRQRSIDLFEDLLRLLPETQQSRPAFDARGETSFQLAATFNVDPEWQQGLLELQTESARLDRIDVLLRAALESVGEQWKSEE